MLASIHSPNAIHMSHDPAATSFSTEPHDFFILFIFLVVLSCSYFISVTLNAPPCVFCSCAIFQPRANPGKFVLEDPWSLFVCQYCCKIRLTKMELQGCPSRETLWLDLLFLLEVGGYRQLLSQINLGRRPTLGLIMKLCFSRSTLATHVSHEKKPSYFPLSKEIPEF